MNAAKIGELSWESIAIDGEARRYCDQHGVTDHDAFQRVKAGLAEARYKEEIAPFLRVLCRVEMLRQIDRMIVPADGGLSTTIYKPLPVETEAAIAQIKDAINSSARRWMAAAGIAARDPITSPSPTPATPPTAPR